MPSTAKNLTHCLFGQCSKGSSGRTERYVSLTSYTLSPDKLEEEYNDITVKMIFAIVQAVGFFNSFNNPIVYTFMNENFKKSFMAILFCNSQGPDSAAQQDSQRFQRPKRRTSKSAHGKAGGKVNCQLSSDNLELRLYDQAPSGNVESVRSSGVDTYPTESTHEAMLPNGRLA